MRVVVALLFFVLATLCEAKLRRSQDVLMKQNQEKALITTKVGEPATSTEFCLSGTIPSPAGNLAKVDFGAKMGFSNSNKFEYSVFNLFGELNVRAGLELGIFNPYLNINGRVEMELFTEKIVSANPETIVTNQLTIALRDMVSGSVNSKKRKIARMGHKNLKHLEEKLKIHDTDLEKDIESMGLDLCGMDLTAGMFLEGMKLAREFGVQTHKKLMDLLDPYVVRQKEDAEKSVFEKEMDEAVDLCKRMAAEGVEETKKEKMKHPLLVEFEAKLKGFERFRSFANFEELYNAAVRDAFLEVFFGFEKDGKHDIDKLNRKVLCTKHIEKGYDPDDQYWASYNKEKLFKYQVRVRMCSLAKLGLVKSATSKRGKRVVIQNILHMVENIFSFPWEYTSRSHIELRDSKWDSTQMKTTFGNGRRYKQLKNLPSASDWAGDIQLRTIMNEKREPHFCTKRLEKEWTKTRVHGQTFVAESSSNQKSFFDVVRLLEGENEWSCDALDHTATTTTTTTTTTTASNVVGDDTGCPLVIPKKCQDLKVESEKCQCAKRVYLVEDCTFCMPDPSIPNNRMKPEQCNWAEDGDTERHVKKRFIRKKRRSQDQSSTFRFGEKVEACVGGGDKWYEATITRVRNDGTFDIKYAHEAIQTRRKSCRKGCVKTSLAQSNFAEAWDKLIRAFEDKDMTWDEIAEGEGIEVNNKKEETMKESMTAGERYDKIFAMLKNPSINWVLRKHPDKEEQNMNILNWIMFLSMDSSKREEMGVKLHARTGAGPPNYEVKAAPSLECGYGLNSITVTGTFSAGVASASSATGPSGVSFCADKTFDISLGARVEKKAERKKNKDGWCDMDWEKGELTFFAKGEGKFDKAGIELEVELSMTPEKKSLSRGWQPKEMSFEIEMSVPQVVWQWWKPAFESGSSATNDVARSTATYIAPNAFSTYLLQYFSTRVSVRGCDRNTMTKEDKIGEKEWDGCVVEAFKDTYRQFILTWNGKARKSADDDDVESPKFDFKTFLLSVQDVAFQGLNDLASTSVVLTNVEQEDPMKIHFGLKQRSKEAILESVENVKVGSRDAYLGLYEMSLYFVREGKDSLPNMPSFSGYLKTRKVTEIPGLPYQVQAACPKSPTHVADDCWCLVDKASEFENFCKKGQTCNGNTGKCEGEAYVDEDDLRELLRISESIEEMLQDNSEPPTREVDEDETPTREVDEDGG